VAGLKSGRWARRPKTSPCLDNSKALKAKGGKEVARILRDQVAFILEARTHEALKNCAGALVAADQVSVGSWKVKG
jgi:hypothetical protein